MIVLVTLYTYVIEVHYSKKIVVLSSIGLHRNSIGLLAPLCMIVKALQ